MWSHGVYAPFFRPPAADSEKPYPISFVGTCMDGREKLIGYLLDQGLPLHVFGTHWEQRSDLPRRFPDHFHPPVRAEAYGDILRQSMLCLGLVSHSNKDQWTMRSYEVPACASVLLAERTPAHELMFAAGQHVMFFTSAAECADLARTLLADPHRCRQMGSAAFEWTVSQGWAIQTRMRELLEDLLRSELTQARDCP
jgi:hypothetical protein